MAFATTVSNGTSGGVHSRLCFTASVSSISSQASASACRSLITSSLAFAGFSIAARISSPLALSLCTEALSASATCPSMSNFSLSNAFCASACASVSVARSAVKVFNVSCSTSSFVASSLISAVARAASLKFRPLTAVFFSA